MPNPESYRSFIAVKERQGPTGISFDAVGPKRRHCRNADRDAMDYKQQFPGAGPVLVIEVLSYCVMPPPVPSIASCVEAPDGHFVDEVLPAETEVRHEQS